MLASLGLFVRQYSQFLTFVFVTNNFQEEINKKRKENINVGSITL